MNSTKRLLLYALQFVASWVVVTGPSFLVLIFVNPLWLAYILMLPALFIGFIAGAYVAEWFNKMYPKEPVYEIKYTDMTKEQSDEVAKDVLEILEKHRVKHNLRRM